MRIVYHANDPHVGLANAKDLRRFKLFFADTGLLTTLIFKDKDFTENVIYENLLNDKLGVNLGYSDVAGISVSVFKAGVDEF